MTLLITGGCGFIGGTFLDTLLTESFEKIINIDKLTYAGMIENRIVNPDIRNKYFFYKEDISSSIVKDILNKHNPRAIINFAAESHVDRSIEAPYDFMHTNIIGTYNLLECTRQYLSKQSEYFASKFRFIHISTDEVFGSLKRDAPRFSECSKYQPNSPYSASKASSDHLARAYFKTYDIPTIVTNCSNNYGPRQFPEKLIPLTIKNALNEESIPIYGDGKQIRDWIYVDDHCAAINKILQRGTPGSTYNIGSSTEITNIELVNKICNLLDTIIPRANNLSYSELIEYVSDRPGHDKRYAINPEKIKTELGWQAHESLDTGLMKTIKWYLNEFQN